MNADWIRPTGYHFFDMADSAAIFVVCPSKTFAFQAERGVGERLRRAKDGQRSERPLTHELLFDVFTAFEIGVSCIVFTDFRDGVFFTTLVLEMENEIGEKFVEIEARPSDALALAFLSRALVYVSEEMLERCEDASPILEKLLAAEDKS